MKLSKQEIAIIGILVAVFISIVFYAVFAFGGDDTKNVRHKFEAPDIVLNESKEDYNSRISKTLRNEPEIKKEDEVVLTPFFDEDGNTAPKDSISSEYLELAFGVETEGSSSNSPSKNVPTKKTSGKRTEKPKITKSAKTVVIEQEPEVVEVMKIEEKPEEILIVKRRYSQQAKAGLQSINNNLKASVYGQQKVYNKSLLKMRLLSPLALTEEVVIPRNTFIYGVTQFSSERIKIDIKSITYKDVIYPVKYSVCDANDGLEGIFVGGDVINDVADEANSTLTSRGISSIGVGIISDIGQEVKTWTKKKSVTILNEHNLFLK